LGVNRSGVRYRRRRADDAALRERLRELAAQRRRFGYRRLCLLLRREGRLVNHKRVYRLYRAAGLSVRKRCRKRVSREARLPLEAPMAPNQQWCLDFVSDALAWGRKIRTLPVVDIFTREPLAIEVDTSLPGTRVVEVLKRLVQARGACPKENRSGQRPRTDEPGARPVGI
jgi:putative transposase